MHITGRADRLVELLAEGDDLPVDVHEIIHRLYRALLVPQHEHVVSERLDLQIIVEFYDLRKLRIRNPAEDRLVKLSRLTGRADDQTFPVLIQHTLRDPRSSREILQVRP